MTVWRCAQSACILVLTLPPLPTLAQREAVSVHGRVVFRDTAQAPSPEGIVVDIWPMSEDDTQTRADVGLAHPHFPSATVDSSGTFAFSGIAPDTYGVRVTPRNAPRGWWLRSALVDGRDVVDEHLTLSDAKPVVNMTLLFTNQVSAIVGSLEVPEGRSASAYTVFAISQDPRFWSPSSRRTKRSGVINNRFELKDVVPGPYLVCAATGFTVSQLRTREFYEQLARLATKVDVADGTTVRIDLRAGQ